MKNKIKTIVLIFILLLLIYNFLQSMQLLIIDYGRKDWDYEFYNLVLTRNIFVVLAKLLLILIYIYGYLLFYYKRKVKLTSFIVDYIVIPLMSVFFAFFAIYTSTVSKFILNILIILSGFIFIANIIMTLSIIKRKRKNDFI